MRVLIIEDNEDDFLLATEYLNSTPDSTFETVWKSTLADGITYLSMHPVDVLLLDLGLPDSFGLITFERIAALFSTLPVVIATGIDSDEQAVLAVNYGAQDYLVKGQITAPLLRKALQYAFKRKQAELELRASEERYRSVVEDQVDFLCRYDTDFRLTFVNRSYAQNLFGKRPEDIIGYYLFHAIPEADHAEALAHLRSLTVEHPVASAEHRTRLPDGSERWTEWTDRALFDADGNILEYQGVGRDITAKKRAEQDRQMLLDTLEQRVEQRTAELERVKNHIEAIFNHSGDGILVLDLEHGIQQANFTFDTLLGITADSYVGKRLKSFVVDHDVNRLQAMLGRVKETGDTAQLEVQFKRADGTTFDAEISIAPVNREGHTATVVCIIRDISERKRADRAIAEERNLLRTLIDALPDFIYVKDTQHRYMLINRATARLYGVQDPAEAIGKMKSDFFPKVTAEKTDEDENSVLLAGQSFVNLEQQTIVPTGGELCVLTTKVPLRNLQGEITGLVGISHDHSQFKAQEEALHRSQADLRSVLDSTPIAFLLLDRDGIIRVVNREANAVSVRQYGVALQVGRSMLEYLPPYAHEEFLRRMRLTLAGSSLVFEENGYIDGSPVCFELRYHPVKTEDGEIVGVNVAYEDITERKQAAQTLVALAQRLDLATRSGGIGIWEWDLGANTLDWDDWMYDLHGMTRQEYPLTGESIARLIHPDDAAQFWTASYDMLNAEMLLDTEYRIIRPDGEIRYIKANGIVVPGTDGSPEKMVGVNWDVTEQKRSEAALRQALDVEKELNDLKTRFVSMASHEFRTPLATILTLTETLALYRDKLTEERIDEKLFKIVEQVQHLTEIVEDVLQLSRMQTGHLRLNRARCDLDALCRDVIEEYTSAPGSEHRVQYTGAVGLNAVQIDKKLMRQAISNLVSNAIKYSGDKQPVTVSIARANGNITIRVRDHGIGIPEADLKHLFQAFHRASNVGAIAGTGLGLVIAKEAVELHGGTISVESQVGAGTTFILNIPVEE